MSINHDEIKTYLDARYVSSPEAVWRIFQFPMHAQSHSIYRLPVHLPHCQYVYFKDGQQVQYDNIVEHSKLIAWFKLNAENEDARAYLYTEIPQHFVYNDSQKKWMSRNNVAVRLSHECLL